MLKINLFKSLTALLILAISTTACKKDSASIVEEKEEVPASPVGGFAKGADVSWITEMETSGVKFYNNSGSQQDLLQILKAKGMNTIRLRVWVNPTDGWCNKADVLTKAQRAKNMGFRILIDFHYSDSWADPGKQPKPAAWAGQNISALKTSVYNHTVDVLTSLKNSSIVPEWVQVGNETNNGMLWDEGKASVSMKNFADLVNSGYSGVKAVFPSAKVIVHISNGYDNSLYRWMFDGLKNNGAQWDVIGMSMYPEVADWQVKNLQCLSNMNDMISRYGKEVMIVEVGMPASEGNIARAFISDLITKVNSLPDSKGLGVLYWEPQAYNSWKGYKLGAFDDSGKPTAALDAFLN
ncbi:glycoside hydrolase family 53 protein [Desertivirga brevis]|uniref:glycoside hydrolase family 53 protein n=1 Tax=Desertivirga brevis TaxID=2810310 RepID=UPI001A96F84D|nr:glycosyl hydrolase 53 family protein [Pedobacter sp. SYSU D00873]